MKKILVIAGLMLAGLPVAAQDTYENARMLGSDLNGTARYVGMGGAMEAPFRPFRAILPVLACSAALR